MQNEDIQCDVIWTEKDIQAYNNNPETIARNKAFASWFVSDDERWMNWVSQMQEGCRKIDN